MLLLLCWCFTALQHFSGQFGQSQLTYPYCSWASLLGSLPVLSAHSFVSNWLLPFLNQQQGENGRRNYDQTPQKNVARHEDWTRDRPHGRRTCIQSSYCTQLILCLYLVWFSCLQRRAFQNSFEIGAMPWESLFYTLCEQQRRRLACASRQSDQHLCFLLFR